MKAACTNSSKIPSRPQSAITKIHNVEEKPNLKEKKKKIEDE